MTEIFILIDQSLFWILIEMTFIYFIEKVNISKKISLEIIWVKFIGGQSFEYQKNLLIMFSS